MRRDRTDQPIERGERKNTRNETKRNETKRNETKRKKKMKEQKNKNKNRYKKSSTIEMKCTTPGKKKEPPPSSARLHMHEGRVNNNNKRASRWSLKVSATKRKIFKIFRYSLVISSIRVRTHTRASVSNEVYSRNIIVYVISIINIY